MWTIDCLTIPPQCSLGLCLVPHTPVYIREKSGAVGEASREVDQVENRISLSLV